MPVSPLTWRRAAVPQPARKGRDPQMPQWHESTLRRMGSSVFQILAQAGYLKDTRTMLLQRTHITAEVINYLEQHKEDYVLRCITAGS